jgi:hypothetical protein
MKRSPLITLLTGAVLGIGLWIASMVAASPAPAGYGASAAAATATATAPAPSSPVPATTSAPASSPSAATPSASPSPTSSFVIPAHANYVGPVMAGGGSIAIVVHDTSAIAYYCNGASIEAWLSGVPQHGHLSLTGKDGANAQVNYALGHARGWVSVHGVRYTFSVIAVHKPSGLYRSIAVVRGATVKMGWIVLSSGKEVGSVELDPNAAAPTAQKAPPLNLTTQTASYGGTTVTATPIDAETGSGF